MSLPNIALVGANGSGKSTVAQILFEEFDYHRLSFATPLRSLAMLNPSYAEAVNSVGYEQAKRENPEVREYLIALDEGIRAGDPDYWLSCWDKRRMELWQDDVARTGEAKPTVVDDLRFANEARHLSNMDFKFIQLERAEAGPNDYDPLANISDRVLVWPNNGSIADLTTGLKDLLHIVEWASYQD